MAALLPVAVYTPAITTPAVNPLYAGTDATLASPGKDTSQQGVSGKTVVKDELLVAVMFYDSGPPDFAVPVDTQSNTWTKVHGVTTINNQVTGFFVWTTTASAASSSYGMTFAVPTAARWQRAFLFRFPAGTAVGSVSAPTPNPAGSGVPSQTVTTTSADSMLLGLFGDWQGLTTAHAFASPAVEIFAEKSSSVGSHYIGRQAAAAPGSHTIAMTSPTGQRVTQVVLVMQTGGGGGTPPPAGGNAGFLAVLMRIGLGVASSSGVSPPPVITHGRQIGAANTGLNVEGVLVGSLVPDSTATFSTGGQLVSGRDFVDTVTLDGNGITLRNSRLTVSSAGSPVDDYYAVVVSGDDCVVECNRVTTPTGESVYTPILVQPTANNTIIRRNDVDHAENFITNYGTNTVIEENHMHEISLASDSNGHEDGIEMYGGSAVIRRNRIQMGVNTRDGVVNIGSWAAGTGPAGGADVDYCHVLDNFLDGGQAIILFDDGKPGGVGTRNVRVLGNDMGGHTFLGTHGRYKTLQNNDGRSIVTTQAQQTSDPLAVWWDANLFAESSDLNPDLSGQTAPAQ